MKSSRLGVLVSSTDIVELHLIDGVVYIEAYCNILKGDMFPSIKPLERRTVFQHTIDPKYFKNLV